VESYKWLQPRNYRLIFKYMTRVEVTGKWKRINRITNVKNLKSKP